MIGYNDYGASKQDLWDLKPIWSGRNGRGLN